MDFHADLQSPELSTSCESFATGFSSTPCRGEHDGPLSWRLRTCNAVAARWCGKETAGHILVSEPMYHLIRADAGISSAVIRLSTAHSIFASARDRAESGREGADR